MSASLRSARSSAACCSSVSPSYIVIHLLPLKSIVSPARSAYPERRSSSGTEELVAPRLSYRALADHRITFCVVSAPATPGGFSAELRRSSTCGSVARPTLVPARLHAGGARRSGLNAFRRSKARGVWIYFNNDRSGFAVKNALALRQRLRTLPRRPRPYAGAVLLPPALDVVSQTGAARLRPYAARCPRFCHCPAPSAFHAVQRPIPRLRLLTFNIAHGREPEPHSGTHSPAQKLRNNLRKIAKLIEKMQPDIVALQEIDECSRWAGNFDHLEYLRTHAGFPHAVFGINNRRKGLINLCYGNALLSRHPIMATETVVFGQASVGEKGFLFAELDIGGRLVPVVNVHLHFGSREYRIRQIGRMLGLACAKSSARRGPHWDLPADHLRWFSNPRGSADATAALLSHLCDYADYTLHPPQREDLSFAAAPAPARFRAAAPLVYGSAQRDSARDALRPPAGAGGFRPDLRQIKAVTADCADDRGCRTRSMTGSGFRIVSAPIRVIRGKIGERVGQLCGQDNCSS